MQTAEYLKDKLASEEPILDKAPFKGNNDGRVDRATEEDVVERIDHLWKKVGIQSAFRTYWPVPHWVKLSKAIKMTFLKTSRKSVVKYNKDDEDGVVDGESNEKFVESIFHLACRKNKY